MADFTAITTQEQLDAVIGDRLKRSEEKWAKRFENYLSPEDVTARTSELTKQVDELTSALNEANEKSSQFDKQIAEKDAIIRKHEMRSVKSKIAHESGLSYEAIEFLKGEDEESIKASAEALKNLMGGGRPMPQFQNEPPIEKDEKRAAMKNLAKNLGK